MSSYHRLRGKRVFLWEGQTSVWVWLEPAVISCLQRSGRTHSGRRFLCKNSKVGFLGENKTDGKSNRLLGHRWCHVPVLHDISAAPQQPQSNASIVLDTVCDSSLDWHQHGFNSDSSFTFFLHLSTTGLLDLLNNYYFHIFHLHNKISGRNSSSWEYRILSTLKSVVQQYVTEPTILDTFVDFSLFYTYVFYTYLYICVFVSIFLIYVSVGPREGM